MRIERFTELSEIYGADLRRWPESERNAAEDVARNSVEAAALLERAAELDTFLDTSRVSAPSGALRERIVGAAPVRRRLSLAGFIWRGVGLAGMGLAGAAAGMMLAGLLVSARPLDEDTYAMTAFGMPFDQGEVQ